MMKSLFLRHFVLPFTLTLSGLLFSRQTIFDIVYSDVGRDVREGNKRVEALNLRRGS